MLEKPLSLFPRCYPDQTRNGTLAFYGWVRQYTGPSTVLLNLGAGRSTNRRMLSFRGEVSYVGGADIDPIVMGNEELDEARVMVGGSIPFSDDFFDVVLSDYVLEHVRAPLELLCEVHRVLKPGGCFFFRTPNKYHYVALVARLSPHWFHKLVANRVRGLGDDAHEPYPTLYRLNSRRAIVLAGQKASFKSVELRFFEAEPSYLMFNSAAFLCGVAYERLVNRFECLASVRANIFGRLVKRGRDPAA